MSSPPIPGAGIDFRFLFESSPDRYLILNPDFTIAAVTDAYLLATMRTRESLLGRGIFEAFPDNPEDKEATGTRNLRESLERAVATRAPDAMAVQKYDIRKPESEGGEFEERHWSPVNIPVFRDGKLACLFHRVEDVTDFIRANRQGREQSKMVEDMRIHAVQMELEVFQRAQELQAANRNLREANESMKAAREAAEAAKKRAEDSGREFEAFSYSVSHDLMAPLRAIDGYSRMFLDKHSAGLGPEALGLLAKVREGAQKMGRLIDDLLDLARISHKPLSRESVDLSAMAREIAAQLRETAPGRTVAFRIEPGVTAVGDGRFLGIALSNLLGNAFKFTGRTAEAVIEFGTETIADRPAFFVRDNGAGFDMRYAGKLFGTFQRLHSAGEFDGTGIGLATVQRIVNRHGGRVWAGSEPGKGAIFHFTLAEDERTR